MNPVDCPPDAETSQAAWLWLRNKGTLRKNRRGKAIIMIFNHAKWEPNGSRPFSDPNLQNPSIADAPYVP